MSSRMSDHISGLKLAQGIAIALTLAYYIVAACHASFSAARTSVHRRLRNFQLGFSCLATLSSYALAFIAIKNSRTESTNDPDVLYALFLGLVWSVLLLGFDDDSKPASYPHYGAWAILLVSHSIVFALQLATRSSSYSIRLGSTVLEAVRISSTAILLGSIIVAYTGFLKRDAGSDEETQPLLAEESAHSKSNGDLKVPKIPDQDELDRLEIRKRPKWQYFASFKIFLPFMYPRSYRSQLFLIGMFVCTLVERVVIVALPLSLGTVVNGLGEHIPWGAIARYGLLKLLISGAGLSMIRQYLSWHVTTSMTLSLNRNSYDHIMNLSADFHDSKKSSLIWQTMHQGQDVIDFFNDCIFQILPTFIDFCAAAVVLTFLFGPYMLFIVTTTTVFFYWMTLSTLSKKRDLNRNSIDAWHEQYYQLTESTMNWATVSHFGQIDYERQRYRDKGDAYRKSTLTLFFYESWTRGVRYAVPAINFVAACCVAALQIGHGQKNVGDFVILVTYWAQLTNPLDVLASNLSRITQKMVNAEKLLVLLEKSPRVQDEPDPLPFTFIEGAVEFENVSFSYDGKRKVADGITFRAAPGQTVALVGRTGGGKSTILKLLFRFYNVDQGRILIDGQNIRHLKMESFRNHIAIIPQTPAVFNTTILENLKYPDLECTEDEVVEACKAAALHDKIMTFTNGYQEKIGERGTKLSGGELQRLAIARAMLKKADILLLDEATSSVDSITEKHIQESLHKLCAGKTTFVIAHRLSTILHADQILVIQDGRVAESGTHETLIKQKGAYNELWSSQLQLEAPDVDGGPRSRSPKKQDAAFLINDLSSNGEDSQTLLENTTAEETDKSHAGERPESSNSRDRTSRNRTSHQAAHAGDEDRGRVKGKHLARALSRRLSRSKSPKNAPQRETSRSCSRIALKADAPEFVPRNLLNGANHSTGDSINTAAGKANKDASVADSATTSDKGKTSRASTADHSEAS
ncbi:hypothetical protein LTR99_006860 [Exophiala xenobiotica]|uniref:Heavy metal tolerance protein n=1 Tax=Vermiconidia calcicola TaxID=1690605 RepID=A0AAV9Q2T6_9PEZI|nr:hypothetical protein LTR96_005122 [Exophiala xenobiotica]KAK5300113.1 hypothetical protein LTR99_006860 [Exophiala xenobiotica]KAK5339345.1 hypothetical protein LTR98_004146 [Exophiala xenobiotica]KAK5531856.1 hypothetical protein LTR25_008186 [Vermiconidia calcicola]